MPAFALGPRVPHCGASVRQVLAHASENRIKYDHQFASLTPWSNNAARGRIGSRWQRKSSTRLAMASSVPGLDLGEPEGRTPAFCSNRAASWYDGVLRRWRSRIPSIRKGLSDATAFRIPSYGLDAAGGIVSTVRDLAVFERARQGVPLSSTP